MSDAYEDWCTDRIEKLESTLARLREAMHAGYMLSHGRAYIRVNNGLLMTIDNARRERLIRKALEEANDERRTL